MEHRHEQFKLFGIAPEIKKLSFGRYALIYRCEIGETEAWYYENRDYFWSRFGELSSSPLGELDQESIAISGVDYDNMRLVSQELKYLQGKDGPVVEFVYETLTDTWSKDVDDLIGSAERGLRTLTRSEVLAPSYLHHVTTDGVNDKAIGGNASKEGSANYTLSFRVRVSSPTTVHYQVSDTVAGSYLVSELDEWVSAGTSLGTAIPTNVVVGWSAVSGTFSAADWSDVKLTNSDTGEVVAHWPLDEKSGSTNGSLDGVAAVDVSGNSYNGSHDGCTEGDAFPYDEDDVGVSTIVDRGKTLYLAGIEDRSDDTRGHFITRWAEPGLLRKRVSGGEGELLRITWEFLGIETPATVVGRVIDRDVGDWLGFQTLRITTMNAPDGTDILGVGDADKQVDDYQKLVPWTRPGIAGIVTTDRGNGTNSAKALTLYQRSPVQMQLRAHVEVFMSASEAISDSDFDTITGGTGVKYWNPTTWAVLEGVPNATNAEPSSVEPNAISRTLRGFRKITSSDDDWDNTGDDLLKDTGDCDHGYEASGAGIFTYGGWFGSYIVSSSTTDGNTWGTASIVEGPERPEGKIWVLDVDNRKMFTDEDGVDYYRKTYVWSYIPDIEAGEDVFDDAP